MFSSYLTQATAGIFQSPHRKEPPFISSIPLLSFPSSSHPLDLLISSFSFFPSLFFFSFCFRRNAGRGGGWIKKKGQGDSGGWREGGGWVKKKGAG